MADYVEPTAKARHVIPRERLEYVERLYLKGVSEHRIQSKVSERYGVTTRTARRYLARVRLRLSKLPAAQPEAVRLRSEAMILEAYDLARKAVKYVTFQDGVGPDTRKETRAVPAPEVGTMVNAAARLADLHGASQPKRVDVTSGGEPIGALTDEELRARIAELEAADG